MKAFSLLILGVFLLFGCAEEGHVKVDHEAEIRKELSGFIDEALREFTRELGSSTHPWGPDEKRWEEPHVDPSLLSLVALEIARLDADQSDDLKPLTPRSFWLPIPAEGSYTFNISSLLITNAIALATVEFTQHDGDETYSEGPVDYKLQRNGDRWLIVNLVSAKGFNLIKYLQRRDVMENRTEQNGVDQAATHLQL